GRGAFNGPYGAWSFDPATRVAARTPLIALLPSGLGRLQLAPTQFLRTRTGELERIETLYVDLDLIRANRIDENSRTFFAEFYLSMRASKTSSIDRIKFTNALLNPRTGGRFITVETLHAGGASPTYPRSMRVYKISGRFVFTPELSRYPFDTQRLSIDIRPSAAAGAPFIVQPPPEALRDGAVRSDDWRAAAQFVSVDTDFVPVVDAFTHAPSVVPFYTASFVWMMEREAKDYLLRVVVPLAFILIVAYLSIFIPRSHFEAIITIQVTALLSAVALYITLPELDSDDATISDMIFLFDYLMISVMIGISIMRINQTIRGRRWLSGALGILHVAGVPLSVLAMAAYVDQIALA
ncbi:MAG: amino acid ABC transporter substrate-binding protein, partial [Pseudomonadota bacterium]